MAEFTHTDTRPLEGSRGSSFAGFLIGLAAFLIPVVIVPLASVSTPFTKEMIAIVAAVLLLVSFAASVLKQKSLSVPFSFFALALIALPLAFLISSMFASYPPLSLWGYQLEFDTFNFMLLGSALSILILLSGINARQIFSTLLWFFVGGSVVILFQLVQFFLGGVLPTDIFSSPTINLIGSWNGFGIFLGLIATLTLIFLESMPLQGMHQWIARGVLVLSLFLLATVNFFEVWVVLALVSFGILVHSLLRPQRESEGGSGKGRSITAALVLIVVLFFAITGSGLVSNAGFLNLGGALQQAFGIQTLDVRPSIQSTLEVGSAIYADNPLFGSGPNTFSEQWFLLRPNAIVGTPFWGIAFNSGFASIVSSAMTGGALVAIAWLLLIVALILSVIRTLFSPIRDARSYLTTLLSAAGAIYLALFHLMYVPDITLSILMFIFFGLFMASLREAGIIKTVSVSFAENPRLGFVSIFVVLVFALGGLFFLYGSSTLYASTIYHQVALERSNQGDFNGAQSAALTALGLSEQDRYYQALSAIELARLNVVANNETLSTTERQNQFRDILTSAINASVRATDINPSNYYNWLSRAAVYASVVPLNIEGAYENALQMLDEAKARNPQTPEADFRIAQIKVSKEDVAGARAAAEAALQKKADYTPAILLLADLSLAQGNIADAIDSVEAAVFFEPQNSQLLYQLGLLNLQAERYADARDAFAAALNVNPEYANAAFFLGRALYFLDEKEAALQVFTDLTITNPDNDVLRGVINAITAGENPFAETSSEEIETPTE